MDVLPPRPAEERSHGLLGWLLLPGAALPDQTLRIVGTSYAVLALFFIPLFPHQLLFLFFTAVFATTCLVGAWLVGQGKGDVARIIIGYGAPTFVYVIACAVYPKDMAGVVIGPRLILLAQAVTPFLIYPGGDRQKTVMNMAYNCLLLLSIDGGIGLWADGFKLPMGALNTWAGRTVCTLQALAFLIIVFWSYKRNTRQKEREIGSLLDALTQNTSALKQANDGLRRSEAALTESNQAKDRFFSIIAHDLRTPLNSFEGFSSLLAEHIDQLSTDEVRQMALQMQASHEQVRSLLENLLSWSRAQMQLLEYRPAPTPLQPLLEQLLRLYIPAANAKLIRLELDCPMGLLVVTDSNLLSAVLRNLLSNAIKYSYEGGTVLLTARLMLKGIEISVEDQGLGMEQSQLDNLFKVERKSSTPGTHNERGTGLGLVLVAEFLALMGSRLELESYPGQGTWAGFTLAASARTEPGGFVTENRLTSQQA